MKSDIVLNALINLPKPAYYDFHKQMEGVALIDSCTLQKEEYTIALSFPADSLPECIRVINDLECKLVDVSTSAAPAEKAVPTKTAVVRRKTKRVAAYGSKTKLSVIQDLLSKGKFLTCQDISKETGWTPKSISPRLAELRNKIGLRQKKNGSLTAYCVDKRKAK